MATQLISLMLEMDHLDVEVLFKNGELGESRYESCKNVVLLFGKSTNQIVSSHWIINHNETTHVKVVLAEENSLCSVGAKEDYKFGIEFLYQLFIISCFQSNTSTEFLVIVSD